MFTFITIGLALCFSILLPFSILSLRHTVRTNRAATIRNLEPMFALPSRYDEADNPIPSFEFVKNKYLNSYHDWENNINSEENTTVNKNNTARFSGSMLAFIMSSLPLVVITFAFSVFAISMIIAQILTPAPDAWGLMPQFRHLLNVELSGEDHSIRWVFVVAFLGGYLFAVRSLLRAVNNFDLHPSSFISAALQILLGVITALVIVIGGVSSAIPAAAVAVPASIVVAFTIGFMPEAGLRALYRASQLWLFKREDTDLFRSFQVMPVEVIDGIDTEIRNRLADLNIFSVQNLATANPVMLFVETPFGIFQSIDWVAQAQLFNAVGAKAVLRLWKLGIRTIFDLEKAVLKDDYSTPQLCQAIGFAILYADKVTKKTSENADKGTAEPGTDLADFPMRHMMTSQTDGPIDLATIKALVRNKVDDLHVVRLRQISTRIEINLQHELPARTARLIEGGPLKRASAVKTLPPLAQNGSGLSQVVA